MRCYNNILLKEVYLTVKYWVNNIMIYIQHW